MITEKDIELLKGLTKKQPHVVKLEGEIVLLYSKWFCLELPRSMLDPAFDDWDDQAHDAAIAWRKTMPEGDGEYAQGTRWTNPEDGLALIRLIADSASAIIHPSMYEVVNKHLPEPEFRVFQGDKPVVAIYSEGKLVGGVAQMKVTP